MRSSKALIIHSKMLPGILNILTYWSICYNVYNLEIHTALYQWSHLYQSSCLGLDGLMVEWITVNLCKFSWTHKMNSNQLYWNHKINLLKEKSKKIRRNKIKWFYFFLNYQIFTLDFPGFFFVFKFLSR